MKPNNNMILIINLVNILSVASEKENNAFKKLINKCCPLGEYMQEYVSVDNLVKGCVKPNNLGHKNLDFSDVPLYNKNKVKTGKSVVNVYDFVYGIMLNETFKNDAVDYSQYGHNYYLSKEGILFVESPNQYNWWIELPSDQFCIDYILDLNASVVLGPGFWSILINSSSSNSTKNILLYYVTGLFVSCFFLSLVFLVYLLLPGYRGLSELVQMSYVASTFIGFFFLALIMTRPGSYSDKECMGMSYVVYFFILASFSWMVVMSYDLWRLHSINNYYLKRSTRCKVLKTYRWYSVVAWGVPTALTVFLIVTNHLDLSRTPWFITPNIPKYSCFITGGEQLLYMYIPMSILVLINWVFFFLTSYNLWTQYKETSILDKNNTNKNNHRTFKNRFCLYLKLSIISGISWILEMASSFNANFEFWYITDCYNMLTGLSVFLILVCNKKTYRKLKKRFGNDVGPTSKDSFQTDQ